MQDIPTTEVVAGVRLAKPVLDQDGRVLLRRGAILTDGVIVRLEQWQVSSVCIDSDDATPEKPTAPETRTTTKPSSWSQVFSHLPESPERAILEEAIRVWTEKSKSREGVPS